MGHAKRSALVRLSAARAIQAELFERLALVADAIAQTEEKRAEVHENTADLPGAIEHAARSRRFALAERAAASAFRSHQLPSEEIRQAIRDCRTSADDPSMVHRRGDFTMERADDQREIDA